MSDFRPIFSELLSGIWCDLEAFDCENQALGVSSAEDVNMLRQETAAVGHPAIIQERHFLPYILIDVVSDTGVHVITSIGTTDKEKELITDLTQAREAAYLVWVAGHLLRSEFS